LKIRLAIVKDTGNGFDKIETVKDFVGSYWKVNKIAPMVA